MATFAPMAKAQTEDAGTVEAVISVADQRLAVLRDGELVARFPISTSKFGTGDSSGSYKTPLGRLRVCDKVGEGLASGMVIRHRQATGEVLQANTPGRDPIVTRILWLDGCEGQNANARGRGIYIHGTPEERQIGKPVSWGCIRMRSADVIALYDDLPVGADVTITSDRLPRYQKYRPHPEVIVAEGKKPAAPAPIAMAENQPRAASTPPTRRLPEVAAPPASRHEAEPNNSNLRRNEELMRGSILLSGLHDGNSEIPQLRQ